MRIAFGLLCIALIALLAEAAHAENAGSVVSAVCWETNASHVEASNCMADTVKLYTKKLQEAESKALEQAQKLDVKFTEVAPRYAGFVKYLESSNKAFYAYMEAECARVRQGYTSGNGGGDGYNLCKIDLINLRLERLK